MVCMVQLWEIAMGLPASYKSSVFIYSSNSTDHHIVSNIKVKVWGKTAYKN